MFDEVNIYYYVMLDQMIEGYQWIEKNFGLGIKLMFGWVIDLFGYTFIMVYFFRRVGFYVMLI